MPVYNSYTTVEIFRTDVHDEIMASKVVSRLLVTFPGATINFDLEDCDRILRVEADYVDTSKIISLMKVMEIRCIPLS